MKNIGNCKICGSQKKWFSNFMILNKYLINYYKCCRCGLIQTEKPYWLKEAYSSAIIDSDTGILARNLVLSRIVSLIALLYVGRNAKILDYAGGYGIMVRMLRDIGIDCYWTDKYAENIFAKGFEIERKQTYNIVTAFEYFEQVVDPIKEFKNILYQFKPEILIFSTTLHNGNPPKNWWYFVPEGGQHIIFYTKKSLKYLAKKYNLNFSTNGKNVHVFSKKYIPGLFLVFISIFWSIMFILTKFVYKSKTIKDSNFVANNK